MEKVFSWKAYVTDMAYCEDTFEDFYNMITKYSNWIYIAEGLTEEEMAYKGLCTADEWMIEKED